MRVVSIFSSNSRQKKGNKSIRKMSNVSFKNVVFYAGFGDFSPRWSSVTVEVELLYADRNTLRWTPLVVFTYVLKPCIVFEVVVAFLTFFPSYCRLCCPPKGDNHLKTNTTELQKEIFFSRKSRMWMSFKKPKKRNLIVPHKCYHVYRKLHFSWIIVRYSHSFWTLL